MVVLDRIRLTGGLANVVGPLRRGPTVYIGPPVSAAMTVKMCGDDPPGPRSPNPLVDRSTDIA
jgi:hypothetical protein